MLLFYGTVCFAVQGESDFVVWNDHSYSAIFSCGTVYYAEQGGSTFESVDKLKQVSMTI